MSWRLAVVSTTDRRAYGVLGADAHISSSCCKIRGAGGGELGRRSVPGKINSKLRNAIDLKIKEFPGECTSPISHICKNGVPGEGRIVLCKLNKIG